MDIINCIYQIINQNIISTFNSSSNHLLVKAETGYLSGV